MLLIEFCNGNISFAAGIYEKSHKLSTATAQIPSTKHTQVCGKEFMIFNGFYKNHVICCFLFYCQLVSMDLEVNFQTKNSYRKILWTVSIRKWEFFFPKKRKTFKVLHHSFAYHSQKFAKCKSFHPIHDGEKRRKAERKPYQVLFILPSCKLSSLKY